MAEKEVRKTTRKRAVRKTTATVASLAASARRNPASVARKAPTRIAAVRHTDGAPKVLWIGLLLFLLLLGVSAAIGYSDKGALNVEQTISLRKQNASPEEKQALESVPTEQAHSNVPNGGLVGTGKSAPSPLSPEATGTSTSSTTATTASSTTSATSQDQATTTAATSSADASAS